MVQNGEYPYETAEDSSLSEAVRCAIAYVLTAPLQKLYGFTLTPEAFREISPGTATSSTAIWTEISNPWIF